MLNKIWPAFLIISFIYAILNGNIEEFNNSIFTSCAQTVDLILKLFGTMCLWNGLMKIVQETSLMKKLTKFISPLMKILFPKMKKEDKEYKEITINIIANLLGIGNAATPLGLKAMQTMQEKNPQKDKITANSIHSNSSESITGIGKSKSNNSSSVDCNHCSRRGGNSSKQNINEKILTKEAKYENNKLYIYHGDTGSHNNNNRIWNNRQKANI